MSRRAGLAILILLGWVGGLGLLAWRERTRPAGERLAVAAQRIVPGVSYYAVNQSGEQMGFASSMIDTTPNAIEVTDYFVADLPVGGTLHRASAKSVVHLTRALSLTRFDLDVESEAGPLHVRGEPRGDTALMLAIATGGEAPDTQYIPTKSRVLLPTLVPLAVALGERPKVGKRYSISVFDPTAMGARDMPLVIRAESLFVIPDSARFDSTTRRWRGASTDTVRAWQIVPDSGSGFTGWVDAQGRVVELSQPGSLNLVMRRMAYELAFENWRLANRTRTSKDVADRDVLETTAIAASAPLNNHYVKRLAVRLSNVDLTGYDLPGGRQTLSHDTLSIVTEPASARRAAYRLPNDDRQLRERFRAELAAEPLLQSQHPAIVALAARIRGTDRDPASVAQKIERWVHDSLRKTITFGVPNALQVLNARSGDCNEHTQLFLALARASGIPARSAAGLAYVKGRFYYHAWPEVFLGTWVAVDPTFGEFPADAAHLRFVNGGLNRQAELLRLIGVLKIEVLKSE